MAFDDPNGVIAKANIAALQANVQPTPCIFVQGYRTTADGGGGLYEWNAADTATTDNGGTIIVDTAGHRYYLARNGRPVSPLDFGAKGDAVMSATGGISTTTLTDSNPSAVVFTAADVGKAIYIAGAGTAGGIYSGSISGYVSAQVVTVTPAVSTAVTGASYVYGTDDTAAIQAAVNNCTGPQAFGTINFPSRSFLIGGGSTINVPGIQRWIGTGSFGVQCGTQLVRFAASGNTVTPAASSGNNAMRMTDIAFIGAGSGVPGTTAAGIGFTSAGTSDSLFEGCWFNGMANGIVLSGGNVTVKRCIFEVLANGGVNGSSSTQTQNIFEGNAFYSIGHSGIYLQDGGSGNSRNNIISNCQFVNCGLTNRGAGALSLNSLKNTTVSNCAFYGSNGIDITVNSCSGVVFSGMTHYQAGDQAYYINSSTRVNLIAPNIDGVNFHSGANVPAVIYTGASTGTVIGLRYFNSAGGVSASYAIYADPASSDHVMIVGCSATQTLYGAYLLTGTPEGAPNGVPTEIPYGIAFGDNANAATPVKVVGTVTPNGNFAAPQGSEYTWIGGGAGTTLWVKESGSGNTGWVGK